MWKHSAKHGTVGGRFLLYALQLFHRQDLPKDWHIRKYTQPLAE